MAYFKTNDHERELLIDYFTRQGLSGDSLEEAVAKAKAEIGQGKPLAYITKEQAFYDLLLQVDESVLIPRPDTERLVEKAIAFLPQGGTFVDLGTGSGCIAVTVLKHRQDVTGVALELSPDALKVAERNADLVGVCDRLTLMRKDMRQNPFEDRLFDLVLSNPPYIPRADIAKYPSLAYEPMSALDGGEDGMDFYRTILTDYRRNLKPDGAFLFEIGFDQKDAITALAESMGMAICVYKDYGGNDRVAEIRLKTGL